MFDKICGPAVLYLGFSLVHIIIDAFYGKYKRVLIDVVVMGIFTIFLQFLCINGLTIISWFFVFIPFILFTYITSIILFVFGLDPQENKNKYKVIKNNKKNICKDSTFGCCDDNKTKKETKKEATVLKQ